MPQTIAVLDFGSQLTQVIARRARECQVYSKIFHYSTPAAQLREENVIGIILSGGPQSVYAKKAPHPDPAIFQLGVPILGICYGVQLMGHFLEGEVEHSKQREYGHGTLTIQMRDGNVQLGAGQLYVVPRGVEHCPLAEGEVSAVLIEPAGVVNTGDAGGAQTATYDDSLLD